MLNQKVVFLAALTAVFLVLSSSEVFALIPVENSWTTKAPVPLASWCIVAVNDKIYAIAGVGDYGNKSYWNNSVFEYDPALDTWTEKKPMPTKRGEIAAAVYENKIYVIGGSTGLNQVYDPATDTWENKASMPTQREQFEANLVNGKIYVIGGCIVDESQTYTTLAGVNEVYDPTTDTWTNKTSMPIAVNGYASAVVDNKIYFIGGSGSDTADLNQIYDADTDAWSFGASPIIPVERGAAGATSGVFAPKRIYVFGGMTVRNSNSIGTSDNQVYNPENDSWTVGEPMPTARFRSRLTVLNDQIYVMEGFKSFALYCLVNEQYTPIGYQTPTPSPSPPQPQLSPSISPSTFLIAVFSVIIVAVVLFVYYKTCTKR